MALTFHPLCLQNQNNYIALLQQTPQIASDYSFANLWAWQEEYDLQWAWSAAHNLVWIRQNRPQPVYWAPVGPWTTIDWPQALNELPEIPTTPFIRIPERLSQLWQIALPGKMDFFPEEEHWDYVYDVQELIALRGNKFHKKKNLLNQFRKNYSFTYVPLTTQRCEQALTLQAEWCLWRDCEESMTLEAENQAIVKALSDWEKLPGLMGAGLQVEGHMIAFTVAESLDAETVVIHFEKACPTYKGVYQAINQMFLEHDAPGFTYVNREQDLGDEGLRKAKQSYNPSGYLKKFQARIAEGPSIEP